MLGTSYAKAKREVLVGHVLVNGAVHADSEILVVNKPAGLLIHPTAEGDEDTVVSRAGAEIERRTGRHRRVLVVHRLDRDTSGLLVLALSHDAAESLQRQFRAHSVDRKYLAIVRGQLPGECLVDRAIGRPRPSRNPTRRRRGRNRRPGRARLHCRDA